LKRLGLLGAVAAMAIAPPASATKTFVLQGVTLQGTGPTPGSSATLEGSFSTSDDLTHLEAVNITASAGNYWFNDFTAFRFDDAPLADWVSLPTQGFQISIGSPTDPDQQLHLVLLSFTETGGDIWTGGSFVAQRPAGHRLITGGSVVAAAPAVPEPMTWLMMVGGFGLIGLAMRRRPKVNVTYA
jgi:hypothetical protein